MRIVTLCLLALAFAPLASAQFAFFECQPVGPFPLAPSTDCEGVSAAATLGGNGGPTVENLANCGFPTAVIGGVQYAHIGANNNSAGGGANPPQGGPIPRPLSGYENELIIPIPTGATGVMFEWEFWNAEGSGTSTYNDAFEVSVVDPATGLAVGPPLVYADTWLPLGTCSDVVIVGGGSEVAPNGPQSFNGSFPVFPLPAGAYLSCVCLNGSDNAVQSSAAMDDLLYSATPICTYGFNQPFGTGSIRISISNCLPGDIYLMPITFGAGAFPNGWFYGLDIAIFDLFLQASLGAPFFGGLDAMGNATYQVLSGVPVGLSLYATCVLFDGATAQFRQALTPQSFTTM